MKVFLIIIMVFFNVLLPAQEYVIKGKVVDANSQIPLIGATVLEGGTTNGTITDTDGQFTLIANNQNPILIISFLGYATFEITADPLSDLSVALQPNKFDLSEVVITALNLKRSSKDLGYTVQKVDGKIISEVKSPNFIDNLSGLIAGVRVDHGATGVGSSSKITIRGESSFTNNNPLIVVDGTPINNNTNFNFNNASASGFQEVDFGNGAMDVNQDDISSVSVLKGANAAALYGSRAANGVILITTKSGSNTTGLGVSYNTTILFDTPFKLPEFQNKYGQGNSGEFEYKDGLGGGTNDNITYSWGPELDQGNEIVQYDSPVTLSDGSVVRAGDTELHGGVQITPTAFDSHPDNLKKFYGTGVTRINNIAIGTSSDNGNIRLSLTDLRSKSFIPGVNFNRKTAGLNFTISPLVKLNISSSFQYTNSASDNRPASGYGSENINYSLVAWGPRSLNIENLKDYWQPGLENVQQYSFNYTFFDNPYFILNENRNSFNRDRLFGNLRLSYKISDSWDVNMTSGLDYSAELRKFRRNFSSNRFKSGAYAEQQVEFRETNSSFLVNYQSKISDFSTKFSFGGQRMNRTTYNNQTDVLSLAQPGIFSFSNAASPINVNQLESRKRINSLLGIVKISYMDFVYMDITARNDWSSALASPTSSENVSFFYPSLSLSYILSNTMNLPENISFMKFRTSWAQVGNDADPYLTSSAFVAGTTYNSLPTFSNQSIIPNGSLKPEKTSAIELGTDIRFFDDRFKLDITYFNALTENQIVSFPIPISSGSQKQVINGGAVRSKGVEIFASAMVINRTNFKWSTFLNFSHSKATVESLPEGVDKITLAFSSVYDNVNQSLWYQIEEGGTIGDMYGTGYQRNNNGDFVIDKNGRFVADNNLKKLGNYNPDFILGLNNEFSYKNWSFSFLLNWHQGGEILSRTLSLAGVSGQLKETENRPIEGIVAKGVVNIGTEGNPIWEENKTSISAESYFRQFHDRNHEENNIYDASYLKLRQMAIGYHFVLNKSGHSPSNPILEISLIGRNLFAWSNIPHFDPEQLAVQGNQFVNGVEDMSYPSSRSIGIKKGFRF